MKEKRMLLLGAYSMEVVECGGALCKNVQDGGTSHAAILFAGDKMREDLKRSADILGVSVEFLDFDAGKISGNVEEKIKLIAVIRRIQPDIIITQDTEHCISDLDPGRRPVMPLILEAIALASRPYALKEIPELEPWPCPTIYYMAPEHPNCLVDICSVWEKKCAAMDELEAQLIHFGGPCGETEEECRSRLIPEWKSLNTPLDRGRVWKRQMDLAYYMYPGSTGHNHVLFAEQYRREGCFILDNLL